MGPRRVSDARTFSIVADATENKSSPFRGLRPTAKFDWSLRDKPSPRIWWRKLRQLFLNEFMNAPANSTAMTFTEGQIKDVVVYDLKKFYDDRGWLAELFRHDDLDA